MTHEINIGPVPERTTVTDKRFILTGIWAKWLAIVREIINGNVRAGYGSIGVETQNAMADIDATWQNITGYDVDNITKPLDVTYDKANDGMIINSIY